MIDFTGVTVRYGARIVLRDIDLRVPAGQRVAVVGPNGAGKSTLIRTLLALAPFTGHVRIAGHDARGEGVRARALVGYVPQTPFFPAALAAAEVVAYFQDLRGLPPDPLTLLRLTGLEAEAGHPVRTFSGGMIRRLALATARIGDPPVLLLDEPTSQLDAAGERLVLEWLEAARQEGRTVLLATHHLDGLGAVVDRVVLLEDGRVAADQTTEQLLARRWIEITTPAPLPADLPGAARVIPEGNGRLHLRVPDTALAEVLRVLADRPVHIHEPSLEDLLREARR